MLLCGCTRYMSPQEQVRTFTISHEKSRADVYNATEIWISETFVSAKAVIDVRQPEAGVIIGKTNLSASNGAPWPTIYTFDAAFKFTSRDHETVIVVTAHPPGGDDTPREDVVIKSAISEIRRLVVSFADRMGGKITSEPAAAVPPASTPPPQ